VQPSLSPPLSLSLSLCIVHISPYLRASLPRSRIHLAVPPSPRVCVSVCACVRITNQHAHTHTRHTGRADGKTATTDRQTDRQTDKPTNERTQQGTICPIIILSVRDSLSPPSPPLFSADRQAGHPLPLFDQPTHARRIILLLVRWCLYPPTYLPTRGNTHVR